MTDELPRYRVLTGPDDAAFCRRVSEALEALACGTAVVANERSALPSVLGAAGYPAAADGAAFADAVERALATPAEHRSLLARGRALEFDWARTVQGFLAVHGLVPPVAVAA